MDEIYEWLNPRIPVEYVLSSFLVLSVAIVIGMLVMKGSVEQVMEKGISRLCRFGTIPIFGIGWIILLT